MPQQADVAGLHDEALYGSGPAARAEDASLHWGTPVILQNSSARMRRLIWKFLSAGAQGDSPDLLIAAARIFLALTSLIAISIDSTEPARLAPLARGLLLLYCGYSAAVFLFEKTAKNSARYAVLIHAN